MFALNRLFSKNTEIDVEDQYTKVASLIEEGSVLDRRKISNDRRSTIERRIRLRDAFSGTEKRSFDERRTGSRREKEALQKTINKNSSDPSNTTLSDDAIKGESLNEVEILILDQTDIIENIRLLSETAQNNEFQGIEEKIRDISFNIKSITREEEKLLYLSFDKNIKTKSEKTDKSLAEILFYIHDVSDQVLEYLDRYHYAGVTGANVGFFLLDMNIVYKALSQILNKKKKHLYPMYK